MDRSSRRSTASSARFRRQEIAGSAIWSGWTARRGPTAGTSSTSLPGRTSRAWWSASGHPDGAGPRSAILREMVRQLARRVPLAELHCHLGGAVTPAIMWGIAHAQGIRLPTKDYWEFRDMITVSSRRSRSFEGYLQLFHWTELIQSSPLAVERAVYEVIGG